MIKPFKLNSISFIAAMTVFALSFSALQAYAAIPGKSCFNAPFRDKACESKEARLIKVSCGVCEDTGESGSAAGSAQHADDIILNIKGMTCGGCENRVKGALAACEGVKEVHVSHKDGRAVVHAEEGKVNRKKLIEAVEKAGFSASEG